MKEGLKLKINTFKYHVDVCQIIRTAYEVFKVRLNIQPIVEKHFTNGAQNQYCRKLKQQTTINF